MKTAFVLLAAFGVALAQFEGAPQCAVECLIPAIPATGCAKEDIDCLCKHKIQLKTSIFKCVLDKCSKDEIDKGLAIIAAKCP